MYYVVDENGNRADLEAALDTIVVSTESISAVGLTLTIDGIECYGLYGSVNKNTYITGKTGYSGSGNAIFVDKNHDLSYYFAGSDYVDESESSSVINTANKYGYEWGGYLTTTGTATAIGTGLSNTNSLIEMNLRPWESDWYAVWDKIKEFRETRSSLWFLPSKDELNLIYEAKSNLNNLASRYALPTYWSSSESSNVEAWYQWLIDGGDQNISLKFAHDNRSRLCRQY